MTVFRLFQFIQIFDNFQVKYLTCQKATTLVLIPLYNSPLLSKGIHF